jgi:hypothetical protein
VQVKKIGLTLSSASGPFGCAEPSDAQPEYCSGRGKGFVRGSDLLGANADRDCQMKRVERPERNRGETNQEIARGDGVSILQRVHLEKSIRDVVVEGCHRSALRTGVDVAISTPSAQKAPQLDHGEATERYRDSAAKKLIEFVRTGFAEIALGQSARVDVADAAQRSSRS